MDSHFERTASKLIHFGWEHGRYADFWSLVHLLSGLTFGAFALFLQVPTLYALIAIIGGAIVYEILELGAGVVEDAENAITDVILAGVGASIALYGFDALSLNDQISGLILVFALTGNILLVHQGWHAYLKRKAYAKRSHKYLLMALQSVTLLSIIAIAFVTVKWVW
ncbi:MAG: hypothetical protein V4449_02740 [Patescibacteria group bacterium]